MARPGEILEHSLTPWFRLILPAMIAVVTWYTSQTATAIAGLTKDVGSLVQEVTELKTYQNRVSDVRFESQASRLKELKDAITELQSDVAVLKSRTGRYSP
jgi:phage host-nuclease inhibitor protein Gam